jgi:hypothetical protein
MMLDNQVCPQVIEHQAGGRRRARSLGIVAIAVLGCAAAGACTRVVDVVTADNPNPASCTTNPSDPACAATIWPTPTHSANSDPWIVAHHDVITQMLPRVLVLNFNNNATTDGARATAQRQVNAIAEGSRYHGYSDTRAPIFVAYQIVKVVDLTDQQIPAGWTNPSSTLLPVTPTGSFDPLALFSSRFSAFYNFPDPTTSARSLSLCELFEKGMINEVWLEEGETGIRRVPLNVERKQIYDATGQAVAGSFDASAGGNDGLQDLICGVTVRMAHLDPMRGPGCDLEVRGWGIEGMWNALPAFAPSAAAFLNRDFRTRFNVRFDGWENLCDQTGAPCVSYPTPTTATGTYTTGATWTIDPFVQGCGSTTFPPNARARWDYSNGNPVQSRCEHFGLGDGTAGADLMEPFTDSKIAAADQAFPDCGGGWQIYWRQSIPGFGNTAKTADGSPMRNWWPLLFY